MSDPTKQPPSCPVWNSNTTLEALQRLLRKRVMLNHPMFHAEAELIKSKISSKWGVFVSDVAACDGFVANVGIWFTTEQVESIDTERSIPLIRICNNLQ